MQRRVREHLTNFDELVPKQFGFRVGHSTTHQLMRMVEYVTEAGCRRERTFGCLLDVEKAFDSVQHLSLIHI